MQKTYYPKPGDVPREWTIVDANEKTLGRLASRVARVLLGKDKPEYTPGVEVGDFVIVTNARHITVTGRKLDQKMYYRHSGYPGGLKSISLREQLDRFPDRVVRAAVWGMLPHNRHGRKLMTKLRIYPDADHPHKAQHPKPLEW